MKPITPIEDIKSCLGVSLRRWLQAVSFLLVTFQFVVQCSG